MKSLHELTEPIDKPEEVRELLENLQGNILQGHGRDHSVHVFLRFKDGKQTEVKQWIRELAITSAQQQLDEREQYRLYDIPGRLFINFFLSAKGYTTYFGLGFPRTNPLPENGNNDLFLDGMKASQRRLADRPWTDWEPGYRQEIHVMVLLADDDEPYLLRETRKLLDSVKAYAEICVVEQGRVMRNAQGYTVEHFGYVDGRSQPLFFQKDIDQERREAGGWNVWDSSAGPNLVLAPDPYGEEQDSSGGVVKHHSGSYLVFRKLEQNVRAFKEQEQKLAQALGLIGKDAERAEALVMGRFRDGTPLVLQSASGQSHPVPNNFTYDADPHGQKCPLQSHMRRVNPRLGKQGRHRIVRRGITYGKRRKEPKDNPSLEELPSRGVGLLFICYQKDIRQQFDFLQIYWANNPNTPDIPEQGIGIDPVMGQGNKTELPQPKWPAQWDKPDERLTPFDFYGSVTLQGGEYFFAPSIYFLKNIR